VEILELLLSKIEALLQTTCTNCDIDRGMTLGD